ncbi:MAG TPA: hypothetical protein H9669_06120 [Firmicutes bacterium]|nr:hypothetical protein [Bacillota bacterium]
METDKNALDQWDGFPIMRQVGRISLSFFPARNFITACKRTRCACGLSAAAARLFSSSTFGEGGVFAACASTIPAQRFARAVKKRKGLRKMEKVKRYEIEGTALDIPMHWDECSRISGGLHRPHRKPGIHLPVDH